MASPRDAHGAGRYHRWLPGNCHPANRRDRHRTGGRQPMLKPTEHFMTTWDGTRLFYRAWQPPIPPPKAAARSACRVKDAEAFVRHISAAHDIPLENMVLLAHSVGAVIAAAWVHDYAPPIRGPILGSPAFRVKLYVPLA